MGIATIYNDTKEILKFLLRILFSADSLVAKVSLGALYVVIYDILYRDFVVELFYYMGLEYIEMDPWKYAVWLLLSILPFVFYKGILSISSLLTLLIYLFAYIPTVHAFFVTYGVSTLTAIAGSALLCMLFILYFTIHLQPAVFRDVRIKPQIRFTFVECLSLVLTAIIVAAKAGQMHFVNIFTESDLMYDFRSDNSEAVTGIMLIFEYLRGWLLFAIYPFIMARYLEHGNRLKCLMVILGYVLMFMVDMQKLTLLLPIPMLILYVFVKNSNRIFARYTHSVLIVSILMLSIVCNMFREDEVLFAVSALVLLRTVCVAGWLTQMYLHFFAYNPFTNYGHISPVNALFNNYPYGSEPLGKVVAYGTQNANANLFLTDGYAACGLLGFVVIGIVFYFFLHYFDTITQRYPMTFSIVIITPTLTALLNASLFTLFLTQGLLILICLLITYPMSDSCAKESETEAVSNKQTT